MRILLAEYEEQLADHHHAADCCTAYIWTGELDELLPEFQETPGTVLQ